MRSPRLHAVLVLAALAVILPFPSAPAHTDRGSTTPAAEVSAWQPRPSLAPPAPEAASRSYERHAAPRATRTRSSVALPAPRASHIVARPTGTARPALSSS